MTQIIIVSDNNGHSVNANIITKSKNKLVVVIENTVIRLVLTRTQNSKRYMGKLYGVEFVCSLR